MTEILGKKIVHANLTPEGLEERFQSFGMPEDYSKFMSFMDTNIKHGSEDRLNDVVLSVTGKQPNVFRDFAEAAKATWL